GAAGGGWAGACDDCSDRALDLILYLRPCNYGRSPGLTSRYRKAEALTPEHHMLPQIVKLRSRIVAVDCFELTNQLVELGLRHFLGGAEHRPPVNDWNAFRELWIGRLPGVVLKSIEQLRWSHPEHAARHFASPPLTSRGMPNPTRSPTPTGTARRDATPDIIETVSRHVENSAPA